MLPSSRAAPEHRSHKRTITIMKPLHFRRISSVAVFLIGLVLVGCQQNPAPPVIVNTPPETSTTEKSTSTKSETKQVVPNPDGTVQTKEETTTTETKKKN